MVNNEKLFFAVNFCGKIDEILLENLLELDNYSLPEQILWQSSNNRIEFLEDGQLDPLKYLTPINISLQLSSDPTITNKIMISPTGKIVLE